MPRVGRVIFELPAQPGDMGVDCASADCGAGSPHLAKQLHPRCDCTPASHQREKKPELRAGHAYRLSSPQNRLGGRLQKDAAEANRSSQSCSSTGGEAAGSSQQLFHSGNQLAYDRCVSVSGTVQFTGTSEICFPAFDGERSGDLKLMNDRPCFFDRIERCDPIKSRRGSRGIDLVSCFILIVDDENSRNASIVGAAAEGPGSCGRRYVGADTG